MSKQKSAAYQRSADAQLEQEFFNNPAAVPPFVSLSTLVILASEQLTMFQQHRDLKAGETVCQYMDHIKQECDNVKVDIAMRNFGGK